MKKQLIKAVVVVTAMFLVGCTSKEHEIKENGTAESDRIVNIGVQTLVNPELIVRYEELYEEYLGCRVNIIQFDSGADVNRAFAGGAIDIGSIGSSPAAIGIATDLGYEVFWIHDIIGKAESLVVREGSGIGSLNDLVGKRIGVPFASTAHFSLEKALSTNGIEEVDVNIYDMQPDDIYAAWIRGDIDAAYVWEPVLSKLIASDGRIIISSEELAKNGIVTADLAVINKEFAEQNPDIAVGYIKAQLYAVELFASDRKRAIGEIADAIGIEKAEAEVQVDGFIYPNGREQLSADYFGEGEETGQMVYVLKQSADFLTSQGRLKESPDIERIKESVTGVFIERALNE